MSVTHPSKRHLIATGVVPLSVALASFLIWLGYHASWTGFHGKTLWDWLDLLVIPAVLGAGVFLLNRAERRAQERRSADDRRQQALQEYLDWIDDLILNDGLSQSKRGDKVQLRATGRTHSVLSSLDGRRKAKVVLFLLAKGLLRATFRTPKPVGNQEPHGRGVIDMAGADLSEVELAGANLSSVDLGGAILRGADLGGALLDTAILSDAKLVAARMTGLDVEWIDLTDADLTGADLTGSRFAGAFFERATLTGAILRRTTIHPLGEDALPLNCATLKVAGADVRSARIGNLSAEQLQELASPSDGGFQSLKNWLRVRRAKA